MADFASDVEEETQDQQWRDLYEQSQSKTLFFTSSSSAHLQLSNGRRVAFAGLYRCTLESENNFDDFDRSLAFGEDRHVCHEASRLADGKNLKGDNQHGDLILRNMQFDLSSLRSNDNASNSNETNGKTTTTTTATTARNFLYANSHAMHVEKSDDSNYWEIIRAPLPDAGDFESDAVKDDGSLEFEPVFKTRAVIDWNECDFECCPRDESEDETPYEYKHAYVRTYVRSFVVDEHTGDVFVSWEGFYMDCGDIFSKGKKLDWTIGISRLKIEDPTCALLETQKANDQWLYADTFPRCTEPISIVYQSTRGREVVLPYGGLAVIPATNTGTSKRTFLLSILHSPGIDSGECTSRVWAFPEGSHSIKDGLKRQDLTGTGTIIDSIFFDGQVWDGGTLRLNYNEAKGGPDHFCRTVFNKGIECYPIQIQIDEVNGLPVVESTSKKPTIFLTQDQTEIFCRLKIADKTHIPLYGRKSTTVTGIDVQWDETTGEPHRIFFGCYGGEGGNGNFGSVQIDGTNLKRVMEHAFAEAVLFLPSELEGTFERDYDYGELVYSPPQQTEVKESSAWLWNPVATVALLITLLSLVIYKRRRDKGFYLSSPNALRKETGFGTPYVELPNMSPTSSSMTGTPAPAGESDVII